jgi:hypothetical protein
MREKEIHMGKASSNGPDEADRVLEGQIVATGATPSIALTGTFNLSLWSGSGAGGTAVLQRSFDGGTTWLNCTQLGVLVSLVLAASSSISEVIDSPEAAVLYRLNCAAFTAAFSYRISQ